MYARKDPYEGEDVAEVLRLVADKAVNKRPPVPKSCPATVSSLMRDCLGADAALRPSFEEIDVRIKRMDTETVEPGEVYVPARQRKAARNEDLLQQVFPKHIAEALRDGRKVRFTCPTKASSKASLILYLFSCR